MTDNNSFFTKPFEQRTSIFFQEVKNSGEIFILNDDYGCVMLTTDEEEGVPVWHNAELAKLWATDEWSHCEPLAISVKDWLARWTIGLGKDNLNVMVAPVPAEDGDVYTPDEFAAKL